MTVAELVEHMAHYDDAPVKEFWRLPGVPAGKCCECGADLHTTYPSSILGQYPSRADGVFCVKCRSERDDRARAEAHTVIRDSGLFPYWKTIDSAICWIQRWKGPGETKFRDLLAKSYRSALPKRKPIRTPARERAAAKAIRAGLKRLVKAVGMHSDGNGGWGFGKGANKLRAAHQKQVERFCKVIGAEFTPAGREG